MNRFGPKATKEIAKTMHEFKSGKLKAAGGRKVTDRKQAIAIGISKAKKKNFKVPEKK